MAGCQSSKLLNGSSKHESCSSEVPRTRKKHARPTENCFNTKSHVTLEWDANKKRVIAAQEQIGISWRSLRPFFDSLPCGREILADTFDIPEEIFDLNNLVEVLSQEVWETCLSESERKYLMQFLPVEAEVQKIVKPLFAGDNFQFGNPLLQWGSSLRSGHMHPDAVVKRERRLKAEKKAYYTDLQKYHNDIIGCLLKLKDNWESCNDHEAVSGKIWRSKDIKRNISSSSNGFVVEEGVTASSESSSWVVDERTDNRNSVKLRAGKSHKRMKKKKAIEKDWGQTLNFPDGDLDSDLTAMNGDKTRNTSALSNDGAKYMSCIKISKKQHEIAMNMEKSGDSIHSKSLGPLLGDLQNYQIQPYEVFLEEERKKLNEHWRSVVKDLPSIYAAWRNHQLNKYHIIMSLKKELKEKLDSVMEEMEAASEEEISDPKHEEGLANSFEEKQDIGESTLACHVAKNDDGTGVFDVRANDEDSEHNSQHYHIATENYGEIEVSSDDPIVSPLHPRAFFTRKNSSTIDENINYAGNPGSAVDLRGQVIGHTASIMEENANLDNDSLCDTSLELPSHDQLLKEVLPLGGNHINGLDSLDFEFQNNQVATSKSENALQLEIILPFSAKLGHTNIVNSHGVTLTSSGLKSPKNQITFRSEDSPQPHVTTYSPRLGSTDMIISHGVPLASGGLEAQSNQHMLKPEDAPKPEAISVYSAMSGPTNVLTSHQVPLLPGFKPQRNQITLKCEDGRKPDGVSIYSATSGPTNMIANHGVPLASSGLEGHRNQIILEPGDAQPPIDELAYSARLGPTSMITSRGVPITSAGIEVPRNQMALKSQDAQQPGDVLAYSARLGPTSLITSDGVPFASSGIEAQRNQVTLESQDARQPGDVSAYSARLGNTNMMNHHGVPLTSNSDIWQPVSILHTGYNSAAGFSNSGISELTLPETLIRTELPGQWNNVGCSLPGDAELLQGQINQGPMKHYPEQDQNDLLQSIFKGQGVISYNHEQKYTGLNCQRSNSMLMGNSPFLGHFEDQRRLPLPMERHKAGNAIYMQQNVMDNDSSNMGSFPQLGPEQLLPPNIQDWPMNSVRFPESLAYSIPSVGLSSQNWFAGEHCVRGGWTASDANCAPSESLGNLDHSLYSVLSPCNQLRSTTHYDTSGSTDQFIPARSYEMVGGRNISGISNVLPHSAQSLATNALVSNDTGWINLSPQQNPSSNDTMGKPFMGSWDQ